MDTLTAMVHAPIPKKKKLSHSVSVREKESPGRHYHEGNPMTTHANQWHRQRKINTDKYDLIHATEYLATLTKMI